MERVTFPVRAELVHFFGCIYISHPKIKEPAVVIPSSPELRFGCSTINGRWVGVSDPKIENCYATSFSMDCRGAGVENAEGFKE